MITVRRANDRLHDQRRKREVWRTFYPQAPADPGANGFGALEFLNEVCLPPDCSVPRCRTGDAEIITYVCEGALAYEDSTGRSGVIQAGEFQCRTSGRGIRHSEMNASRTDGARVFQVWLHPSEVGLEPAQQQKRFSSAERRDGLCVVASPDGRRGSLHIHQAVLMYSAILEPGQHVAHELSQGRSAWLHLVRGEMALDGVVLTTGDGAGVKSECVVSFTAREESEILLLDFGERRRGRPTNEGVP